LNATIDTLQVHVKLTKDLFSSLEYADFDRTLGCGIGTISLVVIAYTVCPHIVSIFFGFVVRTCSMDQEIG
jgi:hypothetical protein